MNRNNRIVRDIVCLRNISINILYKGDINDDDDEDNDNNNNNNNNNNNILSNWVSSVNLVIVRNRGISDLFFFRTRELPAPTKIKPSCCFPRVKKVGA